MAKVYTLEELEAEGLVVDWTDAEEVYEHKEKDCECPLCSSDLDNE